MLVISRWKALAVFLICLVGIAFAAPNLISAERAEMLPKWLPHQQINLGLDLQGGSHLLLEVDIDAVIRERLTNMLDGIRAVARQQRLALLNLAIEGKDAISFRARDGVQAEQARNAIRETVGTAQMTTAEDGRIVVRLNPLELQEQRRSALAQSIEIIRRRVDELGTKEPTIQAQGQDRILVQLPGIRDPERIKALIGKTAKLSFHLLDTATPPEAAAAGTVSPDSMVIQGEGDNGGPPRTYVVKRRIMVSGDRLTDAQPGSNSQSGEWIVNFRFDSIGARQFGEVTRQNVGQPLAIVLDNRVISAPVIREPILGGSGQISGNFTVRSATDLAVLLRAGALPAPLKILEERTVGPDLGSDSIEAGQMACIIAYALIFLLMIVSYGLFGMVANLALLLNIIFTLGIMSPLGATLTLPGIAGMVLGLAMAVDANVLIYERMREEVGRGHSPFPACDLAFQRAYITILDSNLTTLIAGLFLYVFGTGPVRGFAVTLSIGIACSMFTSITVTRMVIAGWLHWRRPKELPL